MDFIDPRMPLTVPNLHYGNDDKKPISNMPQLAYPSFRILRKYLPPPQIVIKAEQLKENKEENGLPKDW
jgi:hypothetical protein